MNIFLEFPVLIPIVALVLAELTKMVIILFKHQEVTLQDLMRSGGTPSGHSAFVAALVFVMAANYGFKSAEFTIASALAFIVVLDAIKFRRAAGLHAAALNLLTEDKRFDERLGHTPLEAIAGILFGFAVAAGILSFS